MKAYVLASGAGIDTLRQEDRPARDLGPNDVRVRIGAASINRRDIMFAEGNYGVPAGHSVVPLCDGAGHVIEIGPDVTRFSVGDHVVASFWPHWSDGKISPEKVSESPGAQIDGTLAEQFVGHEDALALAPKGYSSVEACTIPCAGLTAWNALFAEGGSQPGDTVLLLGTGGVSIWALQIGAAAGLRTIVTSSDDAKLATATSLGAHDTINYRTTPEWQDEVLRMTEGRGADLVIEVGGKGTMPRSVAATRMGGTVIVVGGLTGSEGGGVEPGALIGGVKSLRGIMVGSRTMLEDLIRFIEVNGVRPVTTKPIAFSDAPEAYRQMAAGEHFGKIVITVD